MFTVMMSRTRRELRVVRTEPNPRLDPRFRRYDEQQFREMTFLPEHRDGRAPRFATADEAWAYVRERYPQLHP